VRGTTRWSATLLAGVLVLAGCGGDDDAPQAIEPTSEPTEPEEPETPEPEEPDEPEDPFAIPDDIDVAYVQSVVDVLVPLLEEPLLDALASAPHDLPPDPLQRAIQATHSPEASAGLLAGYAGVLSDGEVAQAQLAELEDSVFGWDVREIAVERDRCLVVAFDYRSADGDGASDAGDAYAVLLEGFEDRDPQDLNPTPWVIDRTNFTENTTPEELADRCDVDQAGELDELEEPASDGGGDT
jgi:hypothetical protein